MASARMRINHRRESSACESCFAGTGLGRTIRVFLRCMKVEPDSARFAAMMSLTSYYMRVPTRRSFLGASAALLSGCATRRVSVAPAAARLAPVIVARDRVIRTVVGLRPFRPSGFVVRAEKLDAKTVIHNYGHGGAGITLSWGTAQLAIQEAAKIETRDCAVIGCGVVGLSTARLLQQRGYTVTIYAKSMPP